MVENTTQQVPQKEKAPSMLGTMLRGAIGLGVTAAIVGGTLGAASLAATTLMVNATQVAGAINAVLPALAISGSTTSVALAGLTLGGIGGAILGAPAGAVAAPIYLKQKQTEAMIPAIAEKAMHQGYMMGEQHGKQAGKELEQESTKFRDMITAERDKGHSQGHSV